MSATEILSNKLHYYIENGDYKNIEDLLVDINDTKTLKEIEAQFLNDVGRDPVNLAIDNREENIATYLVEKGFSTDYLYQWIDQHCDQWCYYDHGSDRCPAEYDAVENAEKKNLYRLKNLMDLIKQGKRKPGDGLPLHVLQNQVPHPPRTPKCQSKRQKLEKPPQVNGDMKKKTFADEARECIQKYQPDGKTYVSKTGDTLFHLYIDKPKVYIYLFANAGIPVNIQNNVGDTALHVAVRKQLPEAVQALIQCGADLTSRNLMGQTPFDEAEEGGIKSLLEYFQPGLVAAIYKGDTHTVAKHTYNWCHTGAVTNKLGVVGAVFHQRSHALGRVLTYSWCSFDSIVKEGKTILELAASQAENSKSSSSCMRILQQYEKTSQLIHAVLCEDFQTTKRILQTKRGFMINVRFRDNKGETLLSHAVQANNLDIVKLLLAHEAKINQIRVREDETSDVTVPLFHKALQPHIDQEIAKHLHTKMDISEHFEKDSDGNTAILRAIEEGCSPKLIYWLIKVTEGKALVGRNAVGLSSRELAVALHSDAIVKVIDNYITQNLQILPQFPIHYHREKDILNIKVESCDKNLIELVQEQDRLNLKKWLNFQEVENKGIQLFEAAANGYKNDDIENLYGNYKDRNGYTALIRAVVFQQEEACSYLCTTRPVLKSIADNCNRYPLHYAYALPAEFSNRFVRILLEKNPEDIERKVDKDGRLPADYMKIRETVEIQKILYDARTLDVYGKRGPPLGAWPDGAKRVPPDADQLPM